MRRRAVLPLVAGLGLRGAPKRYRVAVIGHTGRGNYGHGIDTVWRSLANCDLVAVADGDEPGRAAAGTRLGVARTYADYREMLREEKPEIVGIGPRHADQRVEMVTAAAEAGCHIYMEKPFAMTLAEADRMVSVVRQNRVKLQVAHQMRGTPYAVKAKAMVEAGEIGEVEEIRTRGKEDRRAGGEDMLVLGSHLCDMMRFFLGDPAWVVSHVQTSGRELAAGDAREATEPIGKVAGTHIAAMFAFAGGVHGYFASRAVAETHPLRFGTWIYGSKGVLFLANGIYPDGGLWILRTPSWLAEGPRRWEAVTGEVRVPPLLGAGPDLANGMMAADLMRAIETGGRPCCDEEDGRWTIEMIHGVYAAQRSGARVALPMRERGHPLEGWK